MSHKDQSDGQDHTFGELMRMKMSIIQSIVMACVTVIDVVGLVVILRTKRTPRTTRLLICWVILFKIGARFSLTTAKLVVGEDATRRCMHIFTSFVCLICFTHGLISLERCIVFFAYRIHLRIGESARMKNCIFLLWIVVWVLNTSIRFIFCNGHLRDIWGCNQVIKGCYLTLFCVIVFLSYWCYTKIYLLIRSKNVTGKHKVKVKIKTTTLMFICSIANSGNVLLICLEMSMVADVYLISIVASVTGLVSSLIDSALFIYWFKECRLELLKLFAVFCPRMRNFVEKTRIEVYDIVTYRQKEQTLSNTSHLGQQQTGAFLAT